MIQSELIRHLCRQVVFLRTSITAYDRGDRAEAVRIAAIVRVLCHDCKQSSISLFQKLGSTAPQLITTARTVNAADVVGIDFGTFLAGQVMGSAIEYSSIDSSGPAVDYKTWWGQHIFLRDQKFFSRKDVVLAAANKDGGAHVDDPDSKLSALIEGFWLKTTTLADGSKLTTPVEDNHFAMLRRLGEEVLKSPELMALLI
jgi:hypothetical protein